MRLIDSAEIRTIPESEVGAAVEHVQRKRGATAEQLVDVARNTAAIATRESFGPVTKPSWIQLRHEVGAARIELIDDFLHMRIAAAIPTWEDSIDMPAWHLSLAVGGEQWYVKARLANRIHVLAHEHVVFVERAVFVLDLDKQNIPAMRHLQRR